MVRQREWRLAWWVVGLFALWLQTGCLRALPKVTPPVALPAAFSQLGKASMSVRWWEDLGDPLLNQWIALGLQRNLSLRAAQARLEQRKAIAWRAGAGRWPTLTARAEAGFNAGSASFNVSNSKLNAPLLLGLVASYEVDIWGRIRSAFAAARLDVLANQETLRAAAISLTAEIAEVWYDRIERYGQVRLLTQQMGTNQKTLDLLMARFRLGQINAADILQQRQLLETQRGELIWVKAQAKLLTHQLAVLLGRAPNGFRPPQISSFGKLPALPSAGLPAALIRRRPDIRSAYLSVLAAHRRVGEAIADQFPRLTLSASGNVNTAITSAAAVNNWLVNLLAGLLGPIFDGGARRAEVARTKAVVKETLQQYGATILQALREVEDALLLERAKRQQLSSQSLQLKLAAQVIRQIRFRYLNGAENFLRVLDALRSHQALQRTYLTTQRDLWRQRIALCRALAGGWQVLAPPTNATTPSQKPTTPRNKP